MNSLGKGWNRLLSHSDFGPKNPVPSQVPDAILTATNDVSLGFRHAIRVGISVAP